MTKRPTRRGHRVQPTAYDAVPLRPRYVASTHRQVQGLRLEDGAERPLRHGRSPVCDPISRLVHGFDTLLEDERLLSDSSRSLPDDSPASHVGALGVGQVVECDGSDARSVIPTRLALGLGVSQLRRANQMFGIPPQLVERVVSFDPPQAGLAAPR
jgi:hypothetical protein